MSKAVANGSIPAKYQATSVRTSFDFGDHPTNIAPAALQRASRGQPPNGGQPTLSNWVAQRWAARWASEEAASSDPTLLSSDAPLCCLTFRFTGSGF